MKKCRFKSMSLQEFDNWIAQPEAKEASLPHFFDYGVTRTRNILKGTATKKSVKKRQSFIARHGAQHCKNPTRRRAIAIRNWAFKTKID